MQCYTMSCHVISFFVLIVMFESIIHMISSWPFAGTIHSFYYTQFIKAKGDLSNGQFCHCDVTFWAYNGDWWGWNFVRYLFLLKFKLQFNKIIKTLMGSFTSNPFRKAIKNTQRCPANNHTQTVMSTRFSIIKYFVFISIFPGNKVVGYVKLIPVLLFSSIIQSFGLLNIVWFQGYGLGRGLFCRWFLEIVRYHRSKYTFLRGIE